MNLSELEAIIEQSCTSQDHNNRIEAARYLDSLRASPDNWKIGLELLYKAQQELSRFFGLSLLRGVLGTVPPPPPDARTFIREQIWEWIKRALSTEQSVPQYISNNVVSVITLCIKCDFPELWPSAFTDLIALSYLSWAGVDIVVRVLTEFDIEVVSFHEQRTQMESEHNTIVKDAMRASPVVRDIVVFLCKVGVEAKLNNRMSLSSSAMIALSRLISWIDVNLFVELGLPTVYSLMESENSRGSSFTCLLELVKKGMDPVLKVHLIHSTQIIDRLLAVPIVIQDDDDSGLNELGPVLDMLLLELLGCWTKIEDFLLSPHTAAEEINFKTLLDIAPLVCKYLDVLIDNLLLKLFSHPDTDIFTTMLPSLNKLVTEMKRQINNKNKIMTLNAPNSFFASKYIERLLGIIYQLMQYPTDFEFRLDDEDDIEVMDAIGEVRKLFVYCSKVHPDIALNLITSSLQALPQPFSMLPFHALEASLRLLYSYAEGAPSSMINQGAFTSVIAALHASDVMNHPHPQVIMQYYEVGVRYLKQADMPSIVKLVTCLVGPQGLRHRNVQVRCRSAYFLLRVVEGLEGKSSLLLPGIMSFSDLVLVSAGKQSILEPNSETNLLEAISHICASEYECTPEQLNQQVQMFHDMTSILNRQIQDMLEIDCPPNSKRMEEICENLTHKITSLSCISRAFSMNTIKTRPSLLPAIQFSCQTVLKVLQRFCQHSSIVRVAAITYFHGMIKIIHIQSLEYIRDLLALLFRFVDDVDEMESIVKLLNQTMDAFHFDAIPLIEFHFQNTISKIEAIFSLKLKEHGIIEGAPYEFPQGGDPAIVAQEVERCTIQRILLQFFQHMIVHGSSILLHRGGSVIFEKVMYYLMVGLRGGSYVHGNEMSLPLRRISMEAIIGLSKVVLHMSNTLQGKFPASPNAKNNNDNSIANNANNLVPPTPLPSPTAKPTLAICNFTDTAFGATCMAVLLNDFLPMALNTCVDGVSINVKDASTQSFLAEIGYFIWLLFQIDPKALLEKLVQVCRAYNWPEEVSRQFLELVQSIGSNAANAPSTGQQFRDAYKMFIRKTVSKPAKP